jgi:hypothetical protein
MTTSAVVMALAMSDTSGSSRQVATMSMAVVFGYAQVIGWGVVLYMLSPRLARMVAL